MVWLILDLGQISDQFACNITSEKKKSLRNWIGLLEIESTVCLLFFRRFTDMDDCYFVIFYRI